MARAPFESTVRAPPGWRRELAECRAHSKYCPSNASYNLNLRHCKVRERRTKHILNKMSATDALRHKQSSLGHKNGGKYANYIGYLYSEELNYFWPNHQTRRQILQGDTAGRASTVRGETPRSRWRDPQPSRRTQNRWHPRPQRETGPSSTTVPRVRRASTERSSAGPPGGQLCPGTGEDPREWPGQGSAATGLKPPPGMASARNAPDASPPCFTRKCQPPGAQGRDRNAPQISLLLSK